MVPAGCAVVDDSGCVHVYETVVDGMVPANLLAVGVD